MKRNLPLFELTVDGPEQEIIAVSLVEDPAIEVNWYAFSNDKKHQFRSVNDEKRMLAGPFMIPDQRIYRKDENGFEYEVFFTKETIEKASMKFFKTLKNLNINEDHTDQFVSAFITQSWFTSENDKSKEMGFDLPVGTWFGVVHIEDENYWNEYIKTGKFRGFSIEGFLGEKIIKHKKMEIKKFAAVTTVDGVTVYTKNDTEMLLVGDEVFIEVDGVEQPAPDGEHTLESGMILVVSEGKIAEIKEAEATEEEFETETTALETFKKEIADQLADFITRLSALEAKMTEKEVVETEMKSQLEDLKKFTSNKTVSVSATKKVELSTNNTKKRGLGITVEMLNALKK